MATEEITISELELADEVLADMTLPVDTATETRAVTLKQLRAWLGSALPVGSVFASVGRLDDERFTLLDGKTISRIGTYEAFCNKVVEKVQAGTWKACTEEEFNQELSETGQCGKFVVSNDYIRIPKYGNSLYSGVIDGTIPVVGNGNGLGVTNGSTDLMLARSSSSGDASINIRGWQSNIKLPTTNSTSTSALSANGMIGVNTDPTKSGLIGQLNVNSVEVFYYMVISTEGQTAEVGIDINKVYEDLNLKATTDLSNVSSVASSFKEQSLGWGTPNWNAGVSFSSGFVAPSAGFVVIASIRGNNSQNYGYVNGVVFFRNLQASSGADSASGTAIVSKGDVITYSGNADVRVFYPFKGVN